MIQRRLADAYMLDIRKWSGGAGYARVGAESGSESLSGSSADASGMRPYPAW